MNDDWATGAAWYAAAVATGALLLELRRWFESGPRLVIETRMNMQIHGNPTIHGDELYTIVTAYNRGSAPTMIRSLYLGQYDSIFHRWIRKESRAGYVNSYIPGTPYQLPYEILPGRMWQGWILQNDEFVDWVSTGKLFAAISATSRDRLFVCRIKKPKPDIAVEDDQPSEGVA